MKEHAGNIPYVKGYLSELTSSLEKIDLSAVDAVIELLIEAHKRGSRIFTAGNGGSSATASHIVCDFNKGISANTKEKFEMTCLSDSIPTITAIANDYGYEHVFVFQLEGRMKKGDILIAISGSGNSKNIILAAEYAKSLGNKVIALTGFKGGELYKIADVNIHFPLEDMQKAEDAHMIMLHLIARAVADRYGVKMC
ncbi:MAG: SIS domain-containing protein [Methanomassiliicoccaceae archaeon]|nr:SIS domain-containing protein [Methanomassiliicoccaceae archaeon]